MSHSNTKLVLRIILHCTGILVLFTLFSSFFLSASMGLQIYGLLGDSQFSTQVWSSLLMLFLLTSAVWGLGYFTFRSLDRVRRTELTKTRGSIMTETLIVLPVFLMMTSGLAQMGINSMAGILTSVGAFEAGRTIAVWGPEIGNKRLGNGSVNAGDVLEMARLSVATVVTPVARAGQADIGCASSPQLTNFLQGMVGANLSADPTAGADTEIWSYVQSFGTQTFAARAPTKLKSAYCSTTIAPSSLDGIPNGEQTKGGDFVVSVSYAHKLVFPLVSGAFGDSTVRRSYRMRSHIPPNDCLPESPNFFNLNNCSAD